ncbi:MAG: sialate O-acetylesterase, partial [Acidobacteriia bacterium]|nr:sialate O-acetylesterase [Terriglobia bacterium]
MLRVLLGAVVAATLLSAETYHVYYLGGQSNMDGYGKVGELSADLRGVNNAVPIFHGNPTPDG